MPPTMIRSVMGTMRSLCVLGAPQRTQVPAMRVTVVARGSSASNGVKVPPK